MSSKRKKKYAGHNTTPYEYESRDVKTMRDIQKMREELGIPPLQKIIRECLKCDAEFETYRQSDNFMCSKCVFNTKGDNVIF